MTTTGSRPATATELWPMSATELAGVIRRRQVSVREVVEAHLRRIDAVNPALNAIVIRLDEQALAEADAADRMASTGAGLAPTRPLIVAPISTGIPFTVGTDLAAGKRSPRPSGRCAWRSR